MILSVFKILTLFLLFSSSFFISYSKNPIFVFMGGMSYKGSNPIECMLFTSMGVRRLLGDISFIRLIQYYGSHEENEGKMIEHNDVAGHKHYHGENEPEFGKGNYPLFFDMTMSVLNSDPYNKNAVLYAAGSLAFNLERYDEAIAVLKKGLAYSQDWEYYKMLAAIANKKENNSLKLAESLYHIAMNPQTPVTIKNVAAFINKKVKETKRADEIYRLILETTKDQVYLKIAKKNLNL